MHQKSAANTAGLEFNDQRDMSGWNGDSESEGQSSEYPGSPWMADLPLKNIPLVLPEGKIAD